MNKNKVIKIKMFTNKQYIKMIFILGFIFNVMNIACKTEGIPENVPFNRQLNEGWRIQSSSLVKFSGEHISTPDFDTSGWYTTTVPSTVMAALIAHNEYQDIFMGENISKIDTSRFRVPWWYRNVFTIEDTTKNVELIFEGINYRANIWLNGVQIAHSDSVYGGFRIFRFNISRYISKGRNALAVEVFHQKPDEPSIGFVDWAPMAPDRELGLWRPVKLKISGKTSLNHIFVTSKIDKSKYSIADLCIEAEAVNHTHEKLEVLVKGKIEDIVFEKKISLLPNETQKVIFKTGEFPQLKIRNPRLWWTHDLGKPEMYHLEMKIETQNELSYSETITFGIREVEDYISAEGYRGYKLNGVKLLIKGGGWVDGMFLNDTEEKIKTQFEYIRHANMNTIRLEGFWGNSERFYELADEMGLLLMAGWSCQWEWSGYLAKPEDEYMSIRTPADQNLILNYTRDHVYWLRNHPSIFVWVLGSDKLPRPELESKYMELFKTLDSSRPLLMSCKGHTSEISGKTAVKMNGPYDYVSPNYWYIDSLNGGAFGFNTETGPGPQIPGLEVIKSMIPENKLWPINNTWNFHCGRGEFQTLERYLKAFNKRYGPQSTVADFTFKSQASNLEAMKAMFEAFAINRNKTTGIIQWMYNSAWPKLIWQLWDYHLMPNAAFYGARIGARPISIAYNYGNNSVYITNLTNMPENNLSAEIRICSFNGEMITKRIEKISLKENSSLKIYDLKEYKSSGKVYFLSLKLSKPDKKLAADNFYWLSVKKDVPDFKRTQWFYTPILEYADYKDLNTLKKVKLVVNHSIVKSAANYEVSVNIKNPSNTVAFLIELNITGDKSGKSIVPIFWDDNYISLLPGESKELKATFSEKSLCGEIPVFDYVGWNVDKQ